VLHTIIDGRFLVVNSLHSVVDACYPIVNVSQAFIDADNTLINAHDPIIDARHSTVDNKHVIRIPLTLLSIVFATFSNCAAAIRASSCVNRSSLFSASSTSLFPISFFRYFSGNGCVSGDLFVKETLTCSVLLHFFCRNPDEVQDFDQYCGDCVHHFFI
jgi:hypothetical protein